MNDMTNMPHGDGWDGDDGDSRNSIIKGVKLKFTNDFEWVTRDGTVIGNDRKFVAVDMIKTTQKWIDDVPVETQILGPDEKFPDIEALNKAAPEEEMTEKFGKRVGPYQNGYCVYLLDPETMEVFSYPTSTVGGGQAVRELRDTVRLARRVKGLGLYARVRLTHTHMNTDFGGRERPKFLIDGYQTLGPDGAALAAAEPKQIEAKPELAKPKQTEPAEGKADERSKKSSASKPTSGKAAAPFDDPLD